MKDHHHWKFVQQGPLDDAIKTFCDELNPEQATPGVSNVELSRTFYNEDGNWNEVVLRVSEPEPGMTTKDQCHKWMREVSASCDWDNAPIEQNTNQFK
jgi:hypothetical protein